MSATKGEAINARKYGRLLAKTLPRIIETGVESERLLSEVDKLMSKDLTPEEGVLLDLMVKLIEDFEEKHYDFRATTPLHILNHFMEARKVQPKRLWPIIGSKSQTSDILSGRREISKAVAKRLADFFDMPADPFI